MLPRQVDIRPNAPDPVLDQEAVLSLVRRHVPSAKALTGVDESGRKGRAYMIDDDLVLKTQRPHRLRARRVEEFETSLEKEALFLRQLTADDRIRAPRVLGYGREEGVEYVCMTRMRGVGMRRANLLETQRADVLRELGRTLRYIHELPQVPFRESGLFPIDGSPQRLRSRLEAIFAQVIEAIHDLHQDWPLDIRPDQVAARALAVLPVSEDRVALHSNPAPEHVFIDPQTGAFQGVIDFGDAYISHPAFDLRTWRNLQDRTALLEGYMDTDVVNDSFLMTWRVGLVLGEMAAIARGRQAPDQTKQTLQELLSEL